MRKVAIAFAVSLLLTGCVGNADQFSNSVNQAVQDVHTSTVAAVSIGSDILAAAVALAPYIVRLIQAI